MAYKCLDCGHIFEEGEQKNWIENRGEFWGASCYENMSGCPLCKGEYEEAVACKICGSQHLSDDLYSGVCDECLTNYKYDVDMCYKIGSADTDKVELNCFLCALFSKDEIETILYDVLKKAEKKKPIDCMVFIENDKSWFAERLEEEVKKNENAKG